MKIRKEIKELLESSDWYRKLRKETESILYDKDKVELSDLKTILKNIYSIVVLECADIRTSQTSLNNKIRELKIKE